MPNLILPANAHHFDDVDQLRFAQLSGDVNPMHVDAVAARRLVAGRPVVHGIHTLLQALERLPAERWPASMQLECEFLNPVCVGNTVEFSLQDLEGGGTRILGNVAGLTCTRISLRACTGETAGTIGDEKLESLPAHLTEPLARDPSAWPGTRQSLPLPPASFASCFPATCAALGERSVAAFAALSTYVGMVCPGLHSIFSSLTCTRGDDSSALRFEVRRYDARFRIFVIAFDGCLRGELKAFLRMPPQSQPAMDGLLGLFDGTEFAGKLSWVIGGSRGLGELTAKLLAAAGADVLITYAQGLADAQRVSDDINSARRGRCSLAQHIVGTSPLDELARISVAPHAVFYFATPTIFRKGGGVFDAALFAEFASVYVTEFARLCTWLEETAASPPIRMFYPSSTAVAERPRGMTEYAMAKAAAELMIVDLNRGLQHVKTVPVRLPRLPTDQTNTLVQVQTSPVVQVLTPIIQRVLGSHEP